MIRFLPWVIGVIVIVAVVGTWLESRDQGTLSRFVDRVRYGDEGPVERAGRELDEAIEKAAKDLKEDLKEELEED